MKVKARWVEDYEAQLTRASLSSHWLDRCKRLETQLGEAVDLVIHLCIRLKQEKALVEHCVGRSIIGRVGTP